jgi:hypothetical protein
MRLATDRYTLSNLRRSRANKAPLSDDIRQGDLYRFPRNGLRLRRETQCTHSGGLLL